MTELGLSDEMALEKVPWQRFWRAKPCPQEAKFFVVVPSAISPRIHELAMRAGTVVERILSVRGLDQIVDRMRQAEHAMSVAEGTDLEAVMNRYSRAESEFTAAGGYSATSEAEAIATSLGIPERLFEETLDSLSGGQRRRVELARILFSGAQTLLLDEPTNHLDADSVTWLRDYLTKYSGGLVVISHDVNLIETVVNKVFYLDANRNVIDVYNMGWKNICNNESKTSIAEKIDRANAEKKAAILEKQAEKLRAKATKAKAAQGMFRRAEKLLSGLEDVRRSDKVAKLRFPTPAPCGKTPLTATGLSKSYGSLEVFTDVDLAIDKGSRVIILGLNGAGKPRCFECWLENWSPTQVKLLQATAFELDTTRKSTNL